MKMNIDEHDVFCGLLRNKFITLKKPEYSIDDVYSDKSIYEIYLDEVNLLIYIPMKYVTSRYVYVYKLKFLSDNQSYNNIMSHGTTKELITNIKSTSDVLSYTRKLKLDNFI